MEGHGGVPPLHPMIFCNPIKNLPPPPPPPPLGRLLQLKKTPLPLKSEASFQEMIPRKKQKKSETVINTCVSLIKQHWKTMAEIPQKRDFLTWRIENFVRKVKQFVRKYCIT